MVKVELEPLTGSFSVCRLPAGAEPPAVPLEASLFALVVTSDEVSVVCPSGSEPAAAKVEGGWSAFRVAGTLDFGLVGILSALTAPLAQAGISVFAVSTYDTDYLLVKTSQVAAARDALVAAGHRIGVASW